MRVHGGLLAALVAAGCGKVNEVDGDAGRDIDASAEIEVECATGFDAWFGAAFEFPDGGYLGPADFPSTPWRVTGTLSPQDGRARAGGAATGVANHAVTLDGTVRLRAVFVPLAADDRVELFFNADDAGDDGLAIGIDAATGELSARESGRSLGSTSLGALDPDTAYFVEATAGGSALVATLATENFASVPDGEPIGRLASEALRGDPAGTFAGMKFAGGGGSVDNVSVARCGEAPPAYERAFFDDFERPDSETIGSALTPDTPWLNDLGAHDINVGTLLVTSGGVVGADAGQNFTNPGLRVRATARLGTEAWLLLGVNDDLGNSNFGSTLLDMFRMNDTELFVEFGGPPNLTLAVSIDVSTFYFIELAVDPPHGAATMRSGGFDGPVLWTVASDSVETGAVTDTGVSLGSIGPGTLAVDDFAVEIYAPPTE